MAFMVNEPQVIHETIDGEVVIINLGTGNYYSLRDTGADIWSLLVGGIDPSAIVTGLKAGHGSGSDAVELGVTALVDQLVTEGLIVSGPGGGAVEPGDFVGSNTEFVAPVLEKYDDMQDLILLDPVHEVDEEAGWPRARSNGREP